MSTVDLEHQPTSILEAAAGDAVRKGSIGGLLSHVKGEPSLVILRADFKGRAVAIPQSRIGLYVDFEAGTPKLGLAAKAREVAHLIGVDPIDLNVNDIMDMVMYQAEPLKKMERKQ